MQLLANSFIENEESVLQFCNHIKLQPNIYLLTQLNTKYKHKLMLKDPLKDIQMSLKNIVYKTYWNDNTVFSFLCPVNLINMKFTKSFHLLLNVINFIQPSHINIMPAALQQSAVWNQHRKITLRYSSETKMEKADQNIN